ncbi:MAG TPA: methylmalonyl Co-A mutase-associated GTPase MeaB [Thermoanaerobacterales bacterium]|nr:methylmalonyl Co-A mutase-associated GTPase MeaB [Thermoanaerobacterales bacterium]
MDIIQSVLNGDKRSIAKLITLVEEKSDDFINILKKIYKYTGRAITIGITGAPGSGKSSLVNKLTRILRTQNKKVGIIAVDPTSPFTGGAILGDRIRMQDLTLDEGVFIRSMGTRGALGGLSRACYDAVKILDASGMDYIIIETVGVGQSEIDIVKLADIVLLVMVPGMGDDVQAIKAGIMEIGDIFVVNKSDKDGADRLVTEIEMTLDLGSSKNSWKPPVIKTIATENYGIVELSENIEKVLKHMMQDDLLNVKRKSRIKQEIISLLTETLIENIIFRYSEKIDMLIEKVLERQIDPYSAMEIIISDVK